MSNPKNMKMYDPRMVSAAVKAVKGAKEDLDDFVLEAPSSLLEQFDSAISAAQAVADSRQKAGGKSKQPMKQDNPLKLNEQARDAYGRGDYRQAASLWARAEPLVDTDQSRESIRYNLRLAEREQVRQDTEDKVSKEFSDDPLRMRLDQEMQEYEISKKQRELRDL